MGELRTAGDPLIEVIGGLGIRLHTYLPTRTFELAVHGLDIARATGLSFDLPADVLDEATVLAARIGAADGSRGRPADVVDGARRRCRRRSPLSDLHVVDARCYMVHVARRSDEIG